MKRRLITAICFLPSVLFAKDGLPDASLHGYIKDMQSFYFDAPADSTISSGLVHNRLNFRSQLDSSFSLRVEARTRIFYEEQVSLPGFAKAASADNGYVDLTALWIDQPTVVAVTTLDRASAQYVSGRWTITAGRQRINWGVLTVWNPNDLFNAYNYLDFDYEERPGTDAVRVQVQAGRGAEAEGVYAPAKTANQSITAFLYRFNRWQYDFQVLGGSYRGRATAGLGWAGHTGSAGFKGEATWLGSNDSSRYNIAAAMMTDYAISGSWYVSAAALYIRDPSPLTGSTFQAVGENTTITRLMPFPWSFFGSVSHAFSPRLTANASVIYSPEEKYTILFPSVQYNLLQDLDFDFFAQCFYSSSPGQYQNLGTAVFMRLRWSF